MDTDTIVRLGAASERLLADDDFNTIAQLFEAQVLTSLLSTKRPDTAAREELFATIQSLRDFLSFMTNLVRTKSEIEEPHIVDTTDDPRVHDIYDYEE
jgi:hypothetical protein